MGTLSDYYTAAAAVAPPARRWAVGAGYKLDEYVKLGYPLAASRAAILSLPQYADGLAAAGLTATFNAMDPSGGLSPGTVLVDDTFTGTLDTFLENHTADTGQTWTNLGSVGANRLTGDGCVYRNIAPSMFTVGSGLATADCQIDLVLNVKSVITGDLVILGGRTVDNSNLYRAFVTPTAVSLDKLVAGGATSLGTAFSITLTTGAHTLSLRMLGTAISALWDGAVVIGPTTDSQYSAANKPALRVGASGVAQTSSTGAQANRLTVTSL